MSWSGIANNQTVSFDNLQDAVNIGYFYALTTIPVPSLEQITKSDASTYVSIDTSFGPYAAKASNQLVVKSNLRPIFQYSGTFYYYPDTKGWYGWATSGEACSDYLTGSSITVYWNGSLNISTLIFISTPFGLDLGTYPYFTIIYAGITYWITFSGVGYYNSTTGEIAYIVNGIDTCAPPLSKFTMSFGQTIGLGGTCDLTRSIDIYSAAVSVVTMGGQILYTDMAGTTPFVGNTADEYGIILDASPAIVRIVEINGSGQCTNVSNCY